MPFKRFALLLAGLLLPTLASATLVITRTSAPAFYADTANNLRAMYTSFAIYNNGSDLSDSWVTLGSFTGGNVGLAPNEPGLYHLSGIPGGTTKTAYFYVQLTITGSTQGATVSVYGSKPPASLLTSQAFSWAGVISSGQNASNKVNIVTSGPNPPALGGIIDMAVSGDSGNLGSQNVMFFSPSTYFDWDASKFQLNGVDLTWGNGARSATNVLAITGTTTADEGAYTVTYHMRALGSTTVQQVVSPIGFFAQGANIGHTTTGAYTGANFLPTTSLSNYITLSKSADVVYVVYPNPVHYRIKVTNSGVLDATLDQLVDQLPSSPGQPTYVAGSSTWDGIPVGDPVLSGTQLVWAGSYNLPADTSYELAFDLVMAPVVGDYSNTAWGYIGSTLLDRTLDSTDNSPTAWSVHQDFATPTITPTFSASPTRTPSFTLSATRTPTPTISPTYTDVPPGSTLTDSPTPTPSHSPSGTVTVSPSATPSASPTPTASPTSTISPTHSFTHTRTRTPTRTYSPTPTASPAGTATITQTRTASASATSTSTRTATETRTVTPTPSVTLTATESTTFSPSPSFSASPTESVTFSPSPSFSSSPTATSTPSATPSFSSTQSFTSTPSATPTTTATPSFTATPTNSPTRTITLTWTSSPTTTLTSTITPTSTPVSAPSLSKPYPNPFRPLKGQKLRMDLGVAVPGTVKVKAYNLAGEFVRLLLETSAPNGTLTLYWDGKNNQGETVASGTYLIVAETPSGPVRALVAVLK